MSILKLRSEFFFKIIFSIFFLVLSFHIQLEAQTKPIELGNVAWLRNYDEALLLSKKENKPVFILFQEVPGCSTCKNFGSEVMHHPLIIELIESYFVPLAVYNNKGGMDAVVLKKYNEPAWNNPVMRIIDGGGKDLIDRLSGEYKLSAVITYIRKGMQKNGKLIPLWVQNLETELTTIHTKEITMEMYCFWTGEKNLGALNGVVNTIPGFSNGKEVVKVTYNADATTAEKIINEGKKSNCADAVHSNEDFVSKNASSHDVKVKPSSKFTPDKDLHYYLKQSKYASIPMTAMQATKVNSYLGFGKSPEELLSPRQLAFLKKKEGKYRYDKDIIKAWQL